MKFHLSTEEKWLLIGGVAVVVLLVVMRSRSSASTSSSTAAAPGSSTAVPGSSVGSIAAFESAMTAQQSAFISELQAQTGSGSSAGAGTTTTTTPTPVVVTVTGPPAANPAPSQSPPTGLTGLSTQGQAAADQAAGKQLWWIPPGSDTAVPVSPGFQTPSGDRTLYSGTPNYSGTSSKQ